METKKDLFHLPADITYLNCAYMAPLLKTVEDAGIAAVQKRRNPLAYSVDDFFGESDEVRNEFGRLINADPSRVILIPSVSYGMANVAKNITCRKGQNIIMAAGQFPSNYYPWERLAREHGLEIRQITPPQAAANREKEWNERILNAIDQNTCFLALSQTHWADGTLFDLKAIRKRSWEVGALLIIDGTQSVGAFPFDVEEIQPDALVCAGYKWLMGPYALGLAYYGPYFDGGTPLEENWINRRNSEDFKNLVNYQSEYKAGALRYEVGEHSNFNLVPMLLEALKTVNGFGTEAIQSYTGQLIENALEELGHAGSVIAASGYRGTHLFGLRFPEDVNTERLQTKFAKEKIIVSWRGEALRVSPNIYNTREDVELLTSILLQELKVV